MPTINDLYNQIYDQYREEDDPIIAPPVYPDKINKKSENLKNVDVKDKQRVMVNFSGKIDKNNNALNNPGVVNKLNLNITYANEKIGKKGVNL